MYRKCLCGETMHNNFSPAGVVHLLFSEKAQERVESLVRKFDSIQKLKAMWYELWYESGAMETWKCLYCKRLYIGVNGPANEVLVYRLEKEGMGMWDNPESREKTSSSSDEIEV